VKFAKYLANLGYGSRREVEQLFRAGRITHEDGAPFDLTDAFHHDAVRVDDERLVEHHHAAGRRIEPLDYVCSTKEASRLVYELLPLRFRDRAPLMAPVGRLDRDTSGLLLLTDDGQINHRLTSPRSHIPKAYDVEVATEIGGGVAALFASGTMMLESETEPLKPAELQVLDAHHARLTLHEGRYHQVRRMFAAVGNHVNALHRASIGALLLDDLPSGAWRVLSVNEVATLLAKP
jgi:16S rRNA pseudouridine516 synthase